MIDTNVFDDAARIIAATHAQNQREQMMTPDAYTRGYAAGLTAGRQFGRDACEKTHRAAHKAWRYEAQARLERNSQMVWSRAVSRGRLQGAAVVGLLVGVAFWLGRRW